MCGIVGYLGPKQAAPVLMEGLDKLSYRGYDSAGIAVLGENGKLLIRKEKGRIENLRSVLLKSPAQGCAGIGHTRWATHGEPSRLNAHPHTDARGRIAVVHNGIIENHEDVRRKLGVSCISQTDTEVIAHLLSALYDGDMKSTLLRAMKELKGSYALAVLCQMEPEKLFCARQQSPLVMGFSADSGEGYIASDIPALIRHTRDVLILHDGEAGVITRSGMSVYDRQGTACRHPLFHVGWDEASAEKDGWAHFMLKEIHEQPKALRDTFACRKGDWLPISKQEAQSMQMVTIAACGTAYHAALYGAYVLEKLAHIRARAEIASEYRYRDVPVGENEWFMAVSQSGETADTLAALQKAKAMGMRTLAVCNVVGSGMARETQVICTHAGPEMAVASTKAYLTQAQVFLMMAITLGGMRGVISPAEAEERWRRMSLLPELAARTLQTHTQVEQFVSGLQGCEHVFFIGRGLDYALAMEGALKLKEVSYVFSEAYAAGEMKHGPIALLEKGRLVAACITQEKLADKMLSNLQEARARGAQVLAVCTEGLADRVQAHADECVVIPDADEYTAPMLAAIPLQLFAYSMAVARGCDVDKPRNLAKSVTVE